MIKENVRRILSGLPKGVELEAACKTRKVDEILQAVDAGVRILGENYVQEAEGPFCLIGKRVRWHFIGHLQRNKIKKAIRIFDMIETVDSMRLAKEIDDIAGFENKKMEVLLEINSGKEKQKFGILPEEAEGLIMDMAGLRNIKVMGLMTMGPITDDSEDARPYFRKTKELFDRIQGSNIPNVDIKYLSMGMSNTYTVAIQEGANIVRIGTAIFGERQWITI